MAEIRYTHDSTSDLAVFLAQYMDNNSKNNLYMHNKAQALLLQRQSPNKGMPHKNPAKESDTVSVFALHSRNCAYTRHTHACRPCSHTREGGPPVSLCTMPPPDILPAVRSFLKLFYSHLYGIPMKWEPDGDSITWCEGSPSDKGSLVLKGVPHQPLLPDSICAMWDRWPDRWSPTCPLVLQSMIPAVVHKAIFLASHPGARALNLQALVEGCGYKGYPWSWWWLPIRSRMKDLNLLSDVKLVTMKRWYNQGCNKWRRGRDTM